MVAADAPRRSVPAISGAAICAHRLNSARSSVKDMPLPTSSMSGSFQPPGPANEASPTFWWKIDTMLPELAVMSPVVRHRLPVPAPHVHTLASAHAQRLYTLGPQVAAPAAPSDGYRG